MVVLHRVVKDTDAIALGAGNDATNRGTDPLHTEARADRHAPHRHVYRVIRVMHLARNMRQIRVPGWPRRLSVLLPFRAPAFPLEEVELSSLPPLRRRAHENTLAVACLHGKAYL